MKLDNLINYLTKLRDENNVGDFDVAKWDLFEKKDHYEAKPMELTKNDIEVYKDEKVIVIKSTFHQANK